MRDAYVIHIDIVCRMDSVKSKHPQSNITYMTRSFIIPNYICVQLGPKVPGPYWYYISL